MWKTGGPRQQLRPTPSQSPPARHHSTTLAPVDRPGSASLPMITVIVIPPCWLLCSDGSRTQTSGNNARRTVSASLAPPNRLDAPPKYPSLGTMQPPNRRRRRRLQLVFLVVYHLESNSPPHLAWGIETFSGIFSFFSLVIFLSNSAYRFLPFRSCVPLTKRLETPAKPNLIVACSGEF